MPHTERHEHGRDRHKRTEKIRLNERPMTPEEVRGMGLTFWLSSHSKEGKREFEYPESSNHSSSVVVIRITHLKRTDKNQPAMTLREPPATINQEDVDCIDEYIKYATSDRDSFDADTQTSNKILFAIAQINYIRNLLSPGKSPTKPLV